MDIGLILFTAVNVGIVLSYVAIAYFIVPNLNIRFKLTKWSGVGFFGLCSLTHAELVYHAWTRTPILVGDLTSWHMLAIHVPQFIAVVLFTIGLYREIGLSHKFLRLSTTHRLLRNTIADIEILQQSAIAEDVERLDEALQLVKQVRGHLKNHPG